jgi:hypothetical protein
MPREVAVTSSNPPLSFVWICRRIYIWCIYLFFELLKEIGFK